MTYSYSAQMATQSGEGNLKMNTPNEPNVPTGQVPEQSEEPTIGFSTDFYQSLKSFKTNDASSYTIVIPRSSVMSPVQAESIIKELSKELDISYVDALIAVSILLQTGGTARGCDGNLSCTVQNKTIKLAQLRKVLSANKFKNCERKLARTLAEPIAEVCFKFGIPGNLSKQILRKHPERSFSNLELIYLSDFQADNEYCPEIIRRFILEAFESKRPSKRSPKGKGGKKSGK